MGDRGGTVVDGRWRPGHVHADGGLATPGGPHAGTVAAWAGSCPGGLYCSTQLARLTLF
jgi:hypothetical protein